MFCAQQTSSLAVFDQFLDIMLVCPNASCGRSFSKQCNLQPHVETRHNQTERRSVCPACKLPMKDLARTIVNVVKEIPAHNEWQYLLALFVMINSQHLIFLKAICFRYPYLSDLSSMSSMEFNKGQNHPEYQVKEEHKFSNSSDFEAWMDGLQNAQCVIKGSNVISGKTYRTYVCRRSCETATYYYKEYVFRESSDVEIRPSRTKSTCKMNAGCASRFWAITEPDCSVTVRYFRIHTGHNPSDPNEMQHLRLSMFLRRQITMQLLNKVEEKSIVRCMNQSLRSRNSRELNVSVRICFRF